MGNNPSKPDVPSAAGSPYVTGSGRERKVTQQPSINTLSGTTTRAAAADPSATKETAIGYSATQNQAAFQQHPQSSQPTEPSARTLDQPDHQDAKIPDPEPRGIPTPDPSNPVQVPNPRMRRDPLPPGMAPQSYYNASAHLQRPPRMPLPIGDATATPGSPLLGPEDSHIGGDLAHDRFVDEQTGHEQSSVPVDEDEGAEDLAPYTPSGVGKAVPTSIEWASHGDKVYVTGTFVNWEKKFRLHRRVDSSGGTTMATTLNLRPGTHHLKFIVDGEMRASDSLPTAVDFTNHLVNYIEVSSDDPRRSRKASVVAPSGVRAPQVVPELLGTHDEEGQVEDTEMDEPEEIPLGDFRNIIPQYLVDLDKEEEVPAYQQAASVIGDAPTPPSLPLFLGKSILNGTTPMKDDSSVLNYPNHTVLNHLATSSIKNGVLATSVTTRYKRKYVTTILYKPAGNPSG
ncbi:hypothetical protein SI65_03445 [Aspergillus cristatus]|uniref:Association with the SNF1 complex (ASC) domain-containing protein n=1 Tax=Aspergillus cristatus TaxID=573508 RepID=A0A1E3BHE7_ASPCR|nr:hypothetical protein SI65_03445 [Aspergillus cristatus]